MKNKSSFEYIQEGIINDIGRYIMFKGKNPSVIYIGRETHKDINDYLKRNMWLSNSVDDTSILEICGVKTEEANFSFGYIIL